MLSIFRPIGSPQLKFDPLEPYLCPRPSLVPYGKRFGIPRLTSVVGGNDLGFRGRNRNDLADLIDYNRIAFNDLLLT
jgi:hypothetical protein